jgi:AcrR family transcriptional regulator
MAERSFAITLPVVAERAKVTVKTVLRHFGSRDSLIEAAWTQAYNEVMAERTTPPGDVGAALRVLISHYERRGDVVLAMLADENDPRAARMNNTGRLAHREWVEKVFSDRLPERPHERSRLIDVLVVATDVYAWKLLRLDRGLSRSKTQERLETLVRTVLASLGTAREE